MVMLRTIFAGQLEKHQQCLEELGKYGKTGLLQFTYLTLTKIDNKTLQEHRTAGQPGIINCTSSLNFLQAECSS